MNEIQAIGTALASLKTAGEIVKAIYDAKLSDDTKSKVASLQQLIFDARQSAFDAQEELASVKSKAAELVSEMVKFETWDEESKRYKLFKSEALQSVVYALKEVNANAEPPHYLCTNCYQKRRKSILNLHKAVDGWMAFLCPECSSRVMTGARGQVISIFPPD